MILLVGEGENEKMSRYILKALREKDADALWIDQNSLPIENLLTLYPVNGKPEGRLYIQGKVEIELSEIKSIYTRIDSLNRSLSLTQEQEEFLNVERGVALDVWLEHTDAMVINRMKSQRSNGSKLYQSWIIQKYGLKIPNSLITNDPEKAKEFIDAHKKEGVIYKSASSERSQVEKITKKHLKRLENLKHCPTLFQSVVPGTDIRVHTLATGEVFASEINSESSDYRYDADRSILPIEIPEKIREICVNLTRDMGLFLSGIDLRRTPEGEYYCFEVNPSPAFAWYEDQTEQPISVAVADMLINAEQFMKSELVVRRF